MERCLAIGARQMFLEVAVDNASAQGLYEEHGFERVGIRPDYYHRHNGERTAAYTMRCAFDRGGHHGPAPAAA
jgi:ribosomal-protein-alanine N-acetyltransferase